MTGATLGIVPSGPDASEGIEFSFDYDEFGNQTQIVDPAGREWLKFYDDQQRLKREVGPVSDGNGTDIPNGYRPAKEWTYGSRGRVGSIVEGYVDAVDPEHGALAGTRSTVYFYDRETGRLRETNFGGRQILHTYKVNGERKEVQVNTGGNWVTQHWRETVFYPNTGTVQSVTTPEGSINYEYNTQGQLWRLRTSAGGDLEYVYNALGAIETIIDRGVEAGGTGQVYRYHYDSATGRRTQLDRPNGTSTHWEYDARGLVSRIHHNKDAVVLLDLEYQRDVRGLAETVTETRRDDGGSLVSEIEWTYEYDALRRLVEAERDESGAGTTTYSYDYDDAGNRISSSDGGSPTAWTYNALGQMIGDGASDYEYDVYGNLKIQRNASNNLKEREYTWAGENRLVEAKIYNASEVLVNTISFVYDADGERVKRSETGAGTRSYLVDDMNPTGLSQALAEIDDSTLLPAAQYVAGEDMLAQAGANGARQQIHEDRLGSTRLLTDGDGDTITDSEFEHAPWGEPLAGDGSLTSLRFTGQYADSDLGHQHHHARWYDPRTANWLSVDPVFDFPGNFGNAYSYAGDDPVNKLDATGANFTMAEVFGTAYLAAELAAGLEFKVGNLPFGLTIVYDQPDVSLVNLYFELILLFASFLPIVGDIIGLIELPSIIMRAVDVLTGDANDASPIEVAATFIIVTIIAIISTIAMKRVAQAGRIARIWRLLHRVEKAADAKIGATAATRLPIERFEYKLLHPTPKGHRIGEAKANPGRSHEIMVIGSTPDVKRFAAEIGENSNYNILRADKKVYDTNVNDGWVMQGVREGRTFQLVSPIDIKTLRRSKDDLEAGIHYHGLTMYHRELKLLRESGYVKVGDKMVPGPAHTGLIPEELTTSLYPPEAYPLIPPL